MKRIITMILATLSASAIGAPNPQERNTSSAPPRVIIVTQSDDASGEIIRENVTVDGIKLEELSNEEQTQILLEIESSVMTQTNERA
jgi:hypothetical protein